MSSFDTIYDYAYRFRLAIEKAQKEGPADFKRDFKSFPDGKCTIVSDLLGLYLNKQGIEVQSIRSGNRSNGHEWLLSYDGIHIDITCDQLLGYNRKVFVSSVPDEFHNRMFQPYKIDEFIPPSIDNEELYNRTMNWLTVIESFIA